MRLVSDIVHYNTSLKHKSFYRPVLDIDQLIMGRDPDGGRPYDAHIGLSKRKFSGHYIFYVKMLSGTSLHDSVFLLSNYSNLWLQLTSVYPRVRNHF